MNRPCTYRLCFACLIVSTIAYGDDRAPVLVPPAPQPESYKIAVPDLTWEPTDIFLPPLEQELASHGGAHLYEPEDVLNEIHEPPCSHADHLRLPECWWEPQPISKPFDYQGSHPILWKPKWKWPGCEGYTWEPRLVGYGSYEVFSAVYEQNDQRRDGIGHQLILDFDLQLTGTERAHIQFRPVGEENTGGSFLQLNDPVRYIDNSTGVPQRWWVEGELHSLVGGLSPFDQLQLDLNYTVGRFPFLLHNGLLMNDEITGIVVGKNTITSTPFSNINVQSFVAIDEVDAFPQSADLYGLHVTGDYRHAFLEMTVARLDRSRFEQFDSMYFALSATQFVGPVTLAGRMMFKEGDGRTAGDGQLYVLESNLTRATHEWVHHHTGIELMVPYVNLFKATSGWVSIANGNFDRLRNSFTVNPLLNLAAAGVPTDTFGASAGVQLFRHHQDESIIPEIAYEEQSADAVFGIGLRYLRKLNCRTFVELRGIKTWSEFGPLRREGVFASTFIVF